MNKYAELLERAADRLAQHEGHNPPSLLRRELRAAAAEMEQAEPAMWAYYLGNGQYTFDCDKPEWLVPLYRDPVAPAVPTLFINYPEDGIPDDAETAYREGYIAGWGASRPAVPEWTTIEDGMPKDKGRWYLFGGFTSGGEWSFDKLYYDLAGRVNGWITAALKTKGITHWLLPEPPEPDAFQSLVRDGMVATQGGKVITARELYKEPDDTDGGEMRRLEKEVTDCVFKHIDRMNDYCQEDPAEKIIDDFVAAVEPIVMKIIDRNRAAMKEEG